MIADTARRARVVIARELACPVSRLTDGATFSAVGADSLDLVTIPQALEDEFGIVLTDNEVAFAQTIGTAIDLIRSKLENGGSFDRRGPASPTAAAGVRRGGWR